MDAHILNSVVNLGIDIDDIFEIIFPELFPSSSSTLSPLHCVSFYCHLDIVQQLFEQYADINEETFDNTPLQFAICYNAPELVRILIMHKEDINHKFENGMSSLSYACKKGTLNIVKILIKSGADLSTRTDELDTPLHLAAVGGHTEIVKVLIENKFDVNAINDKQCTPLHLACMKDNLEIVKILVAEGSNINATCVLLNEDKTEETNITPLHIAVYFNNFDIVGFLLEAGANINVKTSKNTTLLHIACQNLNKYNTCVNIIKLLLEKKL